MVFCILTQLSFEKRFFFLSGFQISYSNNSEQLIGSFLFLCVVVAGDNPPPPCSDDLILIGFTKIPQAAMLDMIIYKLPGRGWYFIALQAIGAIIITLYVFDIDVTWLVSWLAG